MIGDFSYKEYHEIISWVQDNYKIYNFSEVDKDAENFCVIRHDVEFSVERAFNLAEFENTLGIQSTYLFQIRNNTYNTFSIENVKKIRQIHELGHQIGLHVHCGLVNDYNSIEEMIKQDIDMLSKMLKINVQVFSYHRPSVDLLLQNLVIDGYINAYSDTFFHAYSGLQPEKLNVKYIADSNHSWKYGHPMSVNHSKLQLNFHPFSWTQTGFKNKENFEMILKEKNQEMIESIRREIKTFPKEIL